MNQMNNPKVLVIDDEIEILDLFQEVFGTRYQVLTASEGQSGILKAQKELPNIVLLDITMPGQSGLDVCQQLRSNPLTEAIPVIMLTAASHLDNRVSAFENGADDFISKPFDFKELAARIDSKLRRAHSTVVKTGKSLAIANLVLDEGRAMAFVDGEDIQLTSVEFEILKVCVKNAGTIVPRTKFMKEVWGKEDEEERLMDAHIVSLRKKMCNFGGRIKTVYGRGYLLEPISAKTNRDF